MYKEFKFLNCNACKATQWANDVDDYDGLDKSPSKKKIGGRNFIPGDVDDYNASNTPFHCYLKFILLFGLFSLGGSQQAVAGSDFASGLQSISFFGDLGDISKGFASDLFAATYPSSVPLPGWQTGHPHGYGFNMQYHTAMPMQPVLHSSKSVNPFDLNNEISSVQAPMAFLLIFFFELGDKTFFIGMFNVLAGTFSS